MSDYTPSMWALRAEHAHHVSRRWLRDGEELTTVQAMAEWDRALAAHDREVAARALEAAAAKVDLPGSKATGYYASGVDAGYQEAERDIEQWLRNQARALPGSDSPYWETKAIGLARELASRAEREVCSQKEKSND